MPDTRRRSRPAGVDLPVFGRACLAAVVGAALVVLVVHLAFGAIGADFRVQPPGQSASTVGAIRAALVAALVTAVGCGVAFLLVRKVRRPGRVFLAVVMGVLVVFAVNPLLAADQARTVVALEVEHLAAAVVALAALLPAMRPRRR